MTAHTIVSVKNFATGNSGDGMKASVVTITGSASYDTGGSVLDLSDYFATVLCLIPSAQGTAPLGAQYVPDTGNAAATCKVVLIDKDGTQESSTDDMSGTTYQFIAVGAD